MEPLLDGDRSVSRGLTDFQALINLIRMSGTLTDRAANGARQRLNDFAVGDRFLGVTDVEKAYGVSTATAVRALRRLADEGLLDRRQGAGYFVTAHPVDEEDGLLKQLDAKLSIVESTIAEMRAAVDRLKGAA